MADIKIMASLISGATTAPWQHRNRMFRLSVITSAVNKVFVIGLQAIAIPLAYHALGEHQYALYVLLSAALATVSIAQLGAGPGLTQGIAKANAENNQQEESSLFCAALRIVAVTSMVGAAALLAIVHAVPVQRIFGATFVNDRAQILSVTNTCIVALIAQLISGVVDSALAGYQEQAYTNIGAAVANCISMFLLIGVCHYAPSISAMIVVLYAIPTLSRLLNLLYLFRRRPYLVRGILASGRGSYRLLLNIGLAFWVMQLASILEQHSGNFVLAHYSTARATDVFATVFRGVGLGVAAIGLLTQPMWPAFTDAITRKEHEWIRRSFKKIKLILMGYACVFGATVAIAGAWAFEHVLRINVFGYSLLFYIIAAYAVVNTWTHIYYITMMGLQGIWRVAAVQVCENVLMIGIGLILAPRMGPVGMAMAYFLASILLPAWVLPWMMSNTISRVAQDAKATIVGGPLRASQR